MDVNAEPPNSKKSMFYLGSLLVFINCMLTRCSLLSTTITLGGPLLDPLVKDD